MKPFSFARSHALLWIPALGAVACSGTPQDVQTPTATATPSASTAPSDTPASPAATASASASATAAVPPAAPASRFTAVSAIPAPSRLFALDGALVIVQSEVTEIQPEGTFGTRIGVVDGDSVDFSQKIVLEGMKFVVDITGTWPGAVDVLVTGDTGRTGIAEHYTRDKGKFNATTARVGSTFKGHARVGSSLLALQSPMFPFSELPRVVTLRGPALSYKVTAGDPKVCENQKAAIFPGAFGASGDGTVFAIGSTCADTVAVETWKTPGKPSTITELPKTVDPEGARILSGTAKDAWLHAGVLMHYDGTTWTEQAPPVAGASVTEIALAPDGTLWALTSGGPVFALQGGVWRSEPLPAGAAADHLAVTKDGTVWITTATALLRTRRPGDGEGVKLAAADQKKPKARRALSPGSARCTQNVVVLYGFTKVTPDDYDFPLTRKALKGHKEFARARFVVTKDYGQKFFTAMVPDFALGQKLVALVEKEVKGAKPQLVCADPEVVREVKIDLATGEVVK